MVLCTIIATALTLAGMSEIDRRVAAADPATCLSRFLDYPPSKGKLGFPRCLWESPFKPNPNFWLKDVDFSCASPWNDSYGSQRAGTLISKRHIVFARHFPLSKGVRILFVDGEGVVCPCYVEKTKAVGATDIMIGSLETEVTPNIRPARILPEGFVESLTTNAVLPMVTFDQNENVVLAETVRSPRTQGEAELSQREPTTACRRRFFRPLVGGDSGNPAFVLVGRVPALIHCLRCGGTGYGPSVFRYRHEIQSVMDELCPGYRLEQVKGDELK